ncbi:alanine dehydrogenase [Butyricicoccus faecihominis]|uniref:alanine dehydrogenase n=1 Tax=Butyricicoccus faecihominis TaxID=1712515 RepID=UPI002479C545|nr:alanine dehydrogenase [Butyricicoccus faecihominis]MCQ5129759.1 alanine dehydrogenase [Butyricicoccus faecihominis]
MIIGLVKEIKNNEFRVGMTPDCVRAYVEAGHSVVAERGAGLGSGYTDEEYERAGASFRADAAAVWHEAGMIVKVKEPIESEYRYLREGQLLYTYLHLAADRPLTDALLKAGTTAVAYETITDARGGLPCLIPMSEIAGRMAVQEGAKYLETPFGGRGILLSGVPGVQKAEVVIIGGGGVGTNACKIATGMGANVTILDVSAARLAELDDQFSGRVQTLYSSRANILASIEKADLVIGAVLLPGRRTPKLVLREDLKRMKPGAVIVDVAVDQGGCIETTHPTTHQDPVFTVDGVVHYCVANMPGAVSRTSTIALTNTTLGHGLALATKGFAQAVRDDAGLANGVNCFKGRCTCPGAAEAFGLTCSNIMELI